MHEAITGISIKIQGHLKINEFKTHHDYLAGRISKQLLNKRNAVHKDDAAIMIGKAMTDRGNGNITYMVFGNGGTSTDDSGNIVFQPPNVSGLDANLYNPVFFQLVDDTIGALPGNQMAIRHIANSMFSDVEIRCLIGVNQPSGQLPSNTLMGVNNTPYITTATEFGPLQSQFSFDEIGLKLADGTLITHVIFSPVLKTASAILEIIYTLRIAVAQPSAPQLLTLAGLEATARLAAADVIEPLDSLALRFNNSPYLTNMPTAADDSSVGSFSVWLRGGDIFNMTRDIGPSLLSSGRRNTFDISGQGFIRRNPSAIERTNPCQITIPAHGLTTGDQVEFTHVNGGCSELEGLSEGVTVTDTDTFTIDVDAGEFASDYTGPALVTFIDKTQNNTLRVVFRNSDTAPTSMFYWNSAEQIPVDQWTNLLISWDMNHPAGEKILQVYFGDTPLASASDPTYIYDPDAAFEIAYTSPHWMIGKPAPMRTYVNFVQVAREVLRPRN